MHFVDSLPDSPRCPECGAPNVVLNEGKEVYCSACGLVLLDAFLDGGPEWRAFNAEQRESRSRGGPPSTFNLTDKGLSTMVGWDDRDAYGNRIADEDRAQLHRMRRWDSQARLPSHAERNMALALNMMGSAAASLGIPGPVRETASLIYRKASTEDLMRGRTLEQMAVAALYAACRQCRLPRTLDEVADAVGAPAKASARVYRMLARELGLHVPPVEPQEYLPRFASSLDVDAEVWQMARDLVVRARTGGLGQGKSPAGLAGAALYAAGQATGDVRTQKEVADVAGVSEVTLRARVREMEEAGLLSGRGTDPV